MNAKNDFTPWQVKEQGDANAYCLLTDDRRWVIAFQLNVELLTERQKEIIRLIEAAPLMLEACQFALKYLEWHAKETGDAIPMDNVRTLRQAIAKATGETP